MFNHVDIPGWFYENDVQAAKSIISRFDYHPSIVEIGSFLGKSATCWASLTDNMVYCFDSCTLDTHIENFNLDKLLKRYSMDDLLPQEEKILYYIEGYNNIKFTKARSPNEINWTHGKVDIIFLDAAHTNEKSIIDNIKFWDAHLNDGGYYLFHDYSDEFPLVKRLSGEYTKDNQTDVEFMGGSMAAVKKRKI